MVAIATTRRLLDRPEPRSTTTLFAMIAACGLTGHSPVTLAALDGPSNALQLEVDGDPYESPFSKPGQVNNYFFQASENSSYVVEIDQLGLDFTITVTGPDGLENSYNSPLDRDGREWILLEDSETGPYAIRLVSEELTRAVGRHRVAVKSVDTSRDASHYVAALRLTTAGAATWAADEWETREQALVPYGAAVSEWKLSEQLYGYAQALYTVAFLKYWVSYDNAGAVRDATAAAELYRDNLENPTLHANAWLLSAAALIEDLEFDSGLSRAQQARIVHDRLGNAFDMARAEELIGYAYVRKGDLVESAMYRTMSADRFAMAGEWFRAFTPRARAAIIDADSGYTQRAIETLEGIRALLPNQTDPSFRAELLEGLGTAYRLGGNVNKALVQYDAALVQHRRNNDAHGEASALRGLGMTYLFAGDLDLAEGFLREAVAKANGTNLLVHERATTALGTIEYLRGNFVGALKLHSQALELLRTSGTTPSGDTQATSRVNRAYRLILVGRDLTELNRFEDARIKLNEARTLLENLDIPYHSAAATHELGRAWLGDDHVEDGIHALNDALAGYRSVGAEEEQAAVLRELALTYRRMGDFDRAELYGNEAIEHMESVRANIAKPELRALFVAARRKYYEAQVDLLMMKYLEHPADDSGAISRALSIDERGRARMTMDLLFEASVDIRRGVKPQLKARTRELRDALAARVYRQKAPGGVSQDELAEIAELEHALTLVEHEIRTDNPLYHGLSLPETLKGPEIQALLDEDSVLLQYTLGSERSFVWMVTRESIAAVRLADAATIEQAATRLITELRTWPNNAAQLNGAGQALSRLIIDPLPEMPVGARIVIVADGALHYVPFSVLPVESGSPERRFVSEHEIVNLPSMTVLGMLRQARDARQNSDKVIAVLADPVFSLSDPRLAGQSTRQGLERESFDTLAANRFDEEMALSRLPNTEYEARAIEGLVPERQRLIAKGFEASSSLITGELLSGYHYLHIATHGKVNSEFPALSKLFFSNFDPEGRYTSGTLLLDEIYNLDLNVGLIVLSACDTALGKQIRGEGLVGFAQGFLYTGAQSLILSLWQVPDLATAELMSRFYSLLLKEPYRRPSSALQEAQSSMAAERRWKPPYLWAAFILVGDWQ